MMMSRPSLAIGASNEPTLNRSIDGREAIGAVTKTVPELMYTKSVTQVRQRYKVKFMEFLFARVTYP
jgi:hypothetical protein